MNIPFETMTNDARAACAVSPRQACLEETELPKGAPQIREAAFDDYSQIASLQIRNGLGTRPYFDWMALWKGNPVYEELRGQFPIGWVLETTQGEIVGLIANVPFACHFRGRSLLSAAACAWVVDPRYRSYSMLLLDRFMNQKNVDLIVSTTVSSHSEPALKFFEWSKVPVGMWDKSAFWITSYRGFVKSVLNLKSIPMPELLSYPVSAALSCRDLFRVREKEGRSSDHEIELCAGFDSRFDEFWEELKIHHDNTLLACRSRETLAWHFRYSLARQRLWILTACKGSRLVAYAIFDRQDNPVWGLKRIRLVDFQALDSSEHVLPAALRRMLRQCSEDGIHILENVGCWIDRPGLPTVRAPYYRTLPSALYYYKATDKDLAQTLSDPAVWAPTTFDGDASL